jgi:uncharacterized protein (DUF2141 family)
MKSNTYIRKLTYAFVMLAVVATPAFAVAQSDDGDELKKPEKIRSAIGIETGLELYNKEKADTCVPGALQIRVSVNNVSEGGILKLELFGENNFLKKEGKLRRIRVPAANSPQKVCINLPAPGEYAVVTYHDVDGDRRLKKAWNFKPKEPYGLSNNPEIKSLRLPKFSETGFSVPMEGVDIEIDLVDL